MPIWEVDLFIDGSITVKGPINLNVAKGFRLVDQFYSDVELRKSASGASATVTARADSKKLARKAALFFFGQMLDVLAIRTSQPLYISLIEDQPIRLATHSVRRLIDQEEWLSAFNEARSLATNEPTFLRALGWYRKGLYTEDPFDKFLAFWNSIEIVAAKYHPTTDAARGGTKNQTAECFRTLWGNRHDWPFIAADEQWIKNNYETRKDIAHGVASINVEQVEQVLKRLEMIERVSRQFLTDWRSRQLNLEDLPVPQ
jgi:Apea-like HEPN